MTVAGTMLVDGLGTIMEFAASPTLKLSELTLQPPGYTGGGAINTTGLRNLRVRTQAPKKLVSVSSSKGTGKYDPLLLEDAYALQGVNNLITITHPDGATTKAWGWLEEITPGENEEGELPTIDFLVEWSNENDAGVETKPITEAPVIPFGVAERQKRGAPAHIAPEHSAHERGHRKDSHKE